MYAKNEKTGLFPHTEKELVIMLARGYALQSDSRGRQVLAMPVRLGTTQEICRHLTTQELAFVESLSL